LILIDIDIGLPRSLHGLNGRPHKAARPTGLRENNSKVGAVQAGVEGWAGNGVKDGNLNFDVETGALLGLGGSVDFGGSLNKGRKEKTTKAQRAERFFVFFVSLWFSLLPEKRENFEVTA
jgi:hypothetical protein